jgi:hypothetical protein
MGAPTLPAAARDASPSRDEPTAVIPGGPSRLAAP